MADLTLDVARKILDTALAKGVEKKLKPLVVTVLDARGCVKASAAQDGTSLLRSEIAHGKAYGALAMGMGSRALFQRAAGLFCQRGEYAGAGPHGAGARRRADPDDNGALLGAVGVSGDTSDNDEICAIAGIEAAGLKANAGCGGYLSRTRCSASSAVHRRAGTRIMNTAFVRELGPGSAKQRCALHRARVRDSTSPSTPACAFRRTP